MKVEIESTIIPFDINRGNICLLEFNKIIGICIALGNESALREWFSAYANDKFENFNFGFGSTHFWISNRSNGKRILFVPF